MKKRRVNFWQKYFPLALIILVGAFYFGYRQLRSSQIFLINNPLTFVFGQALELNNETTNDSYVEITPKQTLSNNPFTLETWVKIPQPSTGNYIRNYPIATYLKPQSPSDRGYIFKLELEVQETTGTFRPIFTVLKANSFSYTNSNYYNVNAFNSLSPNTWHHIAVTSSLVGNQCHLMLYLNGRLDAISIIDSQEPCAVSTQQPQQLLLGKPNSSEPGISGFIFNGQIDELRLSNTIRYNSVFTPQLTPFTDDQNTLLLLHFDGDFSDASTIQNTVSSRGVNWRFTDSTIVVPPSPSPTPSPVYSIKPSPRPSSSPVASCKPRPACLDSRPACKIPETEDMCPPSPSPSVFSGVSCRPNVYQLKPSDLDISGDLKRYMTADRVVDISTHRVKPGDRYIYHMGLDNYSGQILTGSLTTSTQNVHGVDEPFKILKTFNGCSIGADPKTITCAPYQLPKLPSGGTFASETGMLIQITPEVYKRINTSTLFIYTINRVKATPAQLTGSCGILMLAEPQPKPSPRCIKWGNRQFCI